MGKVIDLRTPQGRKPQPGSWGAAFGAVRPALVLIALATLGVVAQQAREGPAPGAAVHALAALPEPAALAPGERVSGHFARCGGGGDWAELCVIDGDTFRIGERRVRVLGIDTPEVDARCPAEARAAEQATQALQDWLNLGPFVLLEGAEPFDRFGRELRQVVRRTGAGDATQLADFMTAEGGARAYGGGMRGGWC